MHNAYMFQVKCRPCSWTIIFILGGGAEVRCGFCYWFLKHDTGQWQGEQTLETQPWQRNQLDNCSPYPTYDPNHVWCVMTDGHLKPLKNPPRKNPPRKNPPRKNPPQKNPPCRWRMRWRIDAVKNWFSRWIFGGFSCWILGEHAVDFRGGFSVDF